MKVKSHIDRTGSIPVRLGKEITRKAKMPTQTQTHYTQATPPPPATLKRFVPSIVTRRAPWAPLPDDEDEKPERGDSAVLHADGVKRGRRSQDFPDLNISATAEKLGVTKSYLAKVLSGYYRPSMSLALKLCDVLGKDLNYVVSLYKGSGQDTKE